MHKNRFLLDLSNVKLSDTGRKKMLQDIHGLISNLNEPNSTVSVLFEEGAGYCHAEQIRNGEVIAQGGINTSGTIVLAAAKVGDVLSISGNSEGKSTIRLDMPTKPSSPKTYGPGRFGEGFNITETTLI